MDAFQLPCEGGGEGMEQNTRNWAGIETNCRHARLVAAAAEYCLHFAHRAMLATGATVNLLANFFAFLLTPQSYISGQCRPWPGDGGKLTDGVLRVGGMSTGWIRLIAI